MPLQGTPPRTNRFGSTAHSQPRALGSVQACRRLQILRWTDDNLLCQILYEGLNLPKAERTIALVSIRSTARAPTLAQMSGIACASP
jgi:hypothetical protein